MHCCELMDLLLEDPKMPLHYFSKSRAYAFTLNYSPAVQRIKYCPWCAKELPHSLRDDYYEILKKEYALEREFGLQEDPRIPEDFKSDAWWKKRGL